MKGLILTNYYLVYRSIFAYTGLAILVSGILLYFGDSSMHSIGAIFIILFMTMPVTEVIKIGARSGYDKYVLTLPVSRATIVQSHYLFYFYIVIIGALLSYSIFYVYDLVSITSIDGIFRIVSIASFIVLFAGALIFPLLFILGSEKSDAIVIGSGMGGFFATIVLQGLVGYLIELLPLSNLNIDTSIYVGFIYLIFGAIIYIISYFIAVFIYYKKEF